MARSRDQVLTLIVETEKGSSPDSGDPNTVKWSNCGDEAHPGDSRCDSR